MGNDKPITRGRVYNVFPKFINGVWYVNDGTIKAINVYVNGFAVPDEDIRVLWDQGGF